MKDQQCVTQLLLLIAALIEGLSQNLTFYNEKNPTMFLNLRNTLLASTSAVITMMQYCRVIRK